MIFVGKTTKSYNFFLKLNSIITTNAHLKQYRYSKAKYKTGNLKMTVTCPEHGDFSIRVNSLISGGGCPKCGAIKSGDNSRKTTLSFLEELGDVDYDTSKIVYSNAKSKVHLVCHEHGDFFKTPNKLLCEKVPCPKCSKNTGFQNDKSAILYYLSINNGQAYKVGITNRSVKERFSRVDLLKISVIKETYYENGYEAYNAEQKILKDFSISKYHGVDLLRNGNTELFSCDILNLDTEVYNA